ncbi:MAG TPA: crotonase/enoyl-CoA hydratase family protein [Acidimicrobiales bacterium]|nr:crotonase/enoyl-CoA hydratase family protein [Acidimicrobiales bacterium]
MSGSTPPAGPDPADAGQTVMVDRHGSVTVVTINRPEVRNAVDGPTAMALTAALRTADADEECSVVVLTGAGGTFCAGADLKAVAAGRGNRVAPEGDGPMGPTRLVMSKPVLAAVEGHAVAGGLELALWCDLRVAADTAVFGVYCRRWGVPLVDGGTVRLPRLIGQSRAMDMILTGRSIGGREAVEFGLANRLVAEGEALDAAIEMGRSLAAFPQRCLRSDRRSALAQWGAGEAEAMAFEVEIGLETIRSGETRAGAARFSAGAGRHGSFGA